MEIPNRGEWYFFDEVREILNVSDRTARAELSGVRDQLIRDIAQERGRPRRMYHWSAHPRLTSHHQLKSQIPPAQILNSELSLPSSAPAPSATDLALASLRLAAVQEYDARRRAGMPERDAAEATCRDWTLRHRTKLAEVTERLPNNLQRTHETTVELGSFAVSTLRNWSSLYKERNNLTDLVPSWHRRGRKSTEIPQALLEMVYTLQCATVRADVTKAVDMARKHWTGEFPDVSLATWQRRVRELDPRQASRALAHSVDRFRAKESPDIEVDWDQLPWNGQWQLDDVELDWYGFDADLCHILRPKAYAIIRTKTRKWIAVVTSEDDITQEQVQTLVGFTMAAPAGGIPDEIKFERGHVACSDYLAGLLRTLDVKVALTGMNGGKVFAGALPDRAVGNFKGKGVIERGNRSAQDIGWAMPGQIGPEARHTEPSRNELLKALAEKRLKDGLGPLIFPTADKWPAIEQAILEQHNNTPHSALPMTFDLKTNQPRNMTPNEYEQSCKDQVKVMDAKYLPLFATKGIKVKITRNGFRLNNQTYGRFDEDLRRFEEVTAYCSDVAPALCYVEELGRCVDIYEKAAPGDFSQMEQKRHIEKQARNKHEERIAAAATNDAVNNILMINSVRMLSDPKPDREQVRPQMESLDKLADGLKRAAEHKRAEHEEARSRFDFSRTNRTGPVVARRANSLLQMSNRLAAGGVKVEAETVKQEDA